METTKEMIAIGEKVRKAKGKRSYYEISKKSGATTMAIKNIESGAHCSVYTLTKVLEALGCKLEIV